MACKNAFRIRWPLQRHNMYVFATGGPIFKTITKVKLDDVYLPVPSTVIETANGLHRECEHITFKLCKNIMTDSKSSVSFSTLKKLPLYINIYTHTHSIYITVYTWFYESISYIIHLHIVVYDEKIWVRAEFNQPELNKKCIWMSLLGHCIYKLNTLVCVIGYNAQHCKNAKKSWRNIEQISI